jgi:DNA repair protein RadA/Sms
MAKKSETIFLCTECGFESPKWMGQCICGAWNTFSEERVSPSSASSSSSSLARTMPLRGAAASRQSPPSPLYSVISGSNDRLDTGIPELNRVLGGGLTKGTLTLIAGEPGIGKSTLILQAAIKIALQGLTVLYISGEESAEQIRMRADRVIHPIIMSDAQFNTSEKYVTTNEAGLSGERTIPSSLFVMSETDIGLICDAVAESNPAFLIIDSIQTMYTDEISSAAGGVSQIRACTDVLLRLGKSRNMPVFIVAHVTKAGDVAGPKIIEHLVDCVLSFSGERSRDFRLLTASKNRFGTTSEVGAFEMREEGLTEISDLSGCLLDGPLGKTEGTIATAAYEGTRPLLMEIQALTATAGTGFPRRSSIGIEAARLGMILAVLEKKVRLDLSGSDVYINVASGIKPEGTSADLAVALAIWSSAKGIIIPGGIIAIGEIGLAGEIRQVRGAEKIASEAAGLGFTYFILPEKNVKKMKAPRGLELVGVSDIREAIALLQVK